MNLCLENNKKTSLKIVLSRRRQYPGPAERRQVLEAMNDVSSIHVYRSGAVVHCRKGVSPLFSAVLQMSRFTCGRVRGFELWNS